MIPQRDTEVAPCAVQVREIEIEADREQRAKAPRSNTLARVVSLLLTAVVALPAWAETTILNVSYDPTRRFYSALNKEFVRHWREQRGETVTVHQSHGGSGAQARAVTYGLDADVVTLALAYDIDVISQKAGLLPKDWQGRLPQNSTPYTSTVVFLVRKGNPKQIRDWPDLIQEGVTIITPNPKTSGSARWNYLAAWGYALRANNNDEAKAREYLGRLYKNAPVLDTGSRGATVTFTRRALGDVLINWENELLLVANDIYPGEFEIVVPSVSVLAEPPVAIVDNVVDRRRTRDVAEAYLRFLYTPNGQELAGRFYFRPRSQEVTAKYKERFANLDLISIEKFGGWEQTHKIHFADGGIFDQIYIPGR